MKTMDSHLGSRVLQALVMALVSILFLFIVIDLMTNLGDDVFEHDVPWPVVIQYYVYLTPQLLVEFHLGAIAMLVGSLLVLGSASQHNEFTALLACGVPLRRIIRVPILIAATFSLGLYALSETIGPRAAREALEIKEHYFGKITSVSYMNRSGVSWAHLPDGWICHVSKFNRVAVTGENVLMFALRPDIREQIRARRIFWDGEQNKWMLEDGTWSTFYPERGMAHETRPITQTEAPIPETPEQLFAPFEPPVTRSSRGLRSVIEQAESKAMPLTRLRVDYHCKFSVAALPLVMMLLAIPFAIRLRRGGVAVGLGVSIMLGLIYLILYSTSRTLGYMGYLDPIVAAWLTNSVFSLAGIIGLSRRT